MSADHDAALGRGDIDHRLVGLDRDQRVARLDRIARLDLPGDDFGVVQPFAQVGKIEYAHWNSTTERAASRMRASLGM